jgi:L-amino acid N-acyltransferase YncA
MIRDADMADLPGILEIYNDAVATTTAVYDYNPHSLEDRITWFEHKICNGFPVRVSEDHNTIVAYASFGHFRNFPAYKYTIEHSIYVRNNFRRKRIGTELLQDLIRIANNKGYAAMIGVIDSSNEGSKVMHAKLGFTEAGTLRKVGYKFGRWLDVTFYHYKLKGPLEPLED